MGAGEFRQFVAVEKLVETPDGRGGSTGAWVLHWQGPAGILRSQPTRRAIEGMDAGAMRSLLLVNIVIESSDLTEAITTAMRARDVDAGKVFNIIAAQNIDGKRNFITLTAVEGAPA